MPFHDATPGSVVAAHERRVALVIGNSRYAHAMPLANPANDAAAMAATLAGLGFDVVIGIDLDLRAIGDVQGAFEEKLRTNPDVALLFYAGHGLQVDGKNYLVPVDAEITQKAHLASRALLFNDILEPITEHTGASLIFLDACRDNPFARNLLRSFEPGAARKVTDALPNTGPIRGGLARIEKVAGTFIAYATAPDTVAYDGKGQNSPFTRALLANIPTPGLSVGDMMIDVRNAVLEETHGRQEPWDQSSLRSRFYFVPKRAAPPPIPQKDIEAAAEWNVIQSTTSLATLALFKERYPDPPWSDYAEARAAELREADRARQEEEEAARISAVAGEKTLEATERPPSIPRFLQEAASPIEEVSESSPLPKTKREGHKSWHSTATVRVGILLLAGVLMASFVWLQSLDKAPIVGSKGEEKDAVAAREEARQLREENETRTAELQRARAELLSMAAELQRRSDETIVPKPNATSPSYTILRPSPAICSAVEVYVMGAGKRCLDPANPGNREFEDCVMAGGSKVCGPRMVVLPKGEYAQGDETKPVDDVNRRKVTIGYQLAVGKFEATFAEWDACVEDGGCKHKPQTNWGRGRQPVHSVSWDDITKEYLHWLNRKLGLIGNAAYRLPTEAEWEYAARAGTTTTYSFGDTIAKAQAQFSGGQWGSTKQTAEVGKFPSNAFGLHDMHGNLWEWVRDCYANDYKDVPANGSVAPEASGCSRVARGGSWFDVAGHLRSSARVTNSSVDRYASYGFRVVRPLVPPRTL